MLYTVVKEPFKGEENAVLEEVKDMCSMHLKEKAIPKYFINLDTMPYTSNNKQDFKKLEAFGKEYIQSQKKSQMTIVKNM